MLRYNARQRVWRRHNERYDKDKCQGTVKHDIKIMVWGCFTSKSVGRLVRVNGIMDQHQYMEILDKNMIPCSKELFGDQHGNATNWYFQQDNDPKHTAKKTSNWFIEKEVPLMEWPSQSPDLNPIENLWSILDRRCAKRNPSNADALFEVLTEAWKEIPEYILRNLVHSMPTRCAKVIEANGGLTKY